MANKRNDENQNEDVEINLISCRLQPGDITHIVEYAPSLMVLD